YEILEKALAQAREGRMHILGKILETLPAPRPELKPHAPRIEVITVPKDMIGAIIGPGGKIIQGIQEESGAIVTIDEIDGCGRVEISAPGRDSIECAMAKIKAIIAVPEEGEVYTGIVKNIMAFGAFVEFLPGKDGLLHISEISWDRIDSMENSGIKEGDELTVKLIEIDKKTGKFRLSMKALTPRPPRPERENKGEKHERKDRKDNRKESKDAE
ncbi:MAG: S1 RNA-binding domain-containing protein, partial [Bacteroidaceae bacterium]|nr:S1 RNA-binding domain-containing protein [Bacteroidaceae bacterium]